MKKILVIKLGALGDFIQALGPMKAIRSHHRDDRISLLTTKPYEKLARDSGYFDEILIDSRPKWHDLKGWMALKQELNAGRYARVYDLQNNDRTSIYFKLFSPKPEWSGIAKGASHRNLSPERTKSKAYEGHVQTLSLAGVDDIQIDTLDWMKGAGDFEMVRKPYVLLVPGSAPSHPEKRWPAKSYAQLSLLLSGMGIQPVLIGAATERDVIDEIVATNPNACNLGGKTSLMDIPALATNALAAIGNDTGPMHLIAPTGCRTIVLFSGKTNPQRHAPLGDQVSYLRSEDIKDISVNDVGNKLALSTYPNIESTGIPEPSEQPHP